MNEDFGRFFKEGGRYVTKIGSIANNLKTKLHNTHMLFDLGNCTGKYTLSTLLYLTMHSGLFNLRGT